MWIDCDVLQADGGTRTASITGGFIALVLALDTIRSAGKIKTIPIDDYVAAISVGVVAGNPVADLAYDEDSKADVDMNVVKTGNGRFVEVQGTAEGPPFEQDTLTRLLELADGSIRHLIGLQRQIVGDALSTHQYPGIVRLLVATTNPNKLIEIRGILSDLPVTIASLAQFPDAVELWRMASRSAENARKKATHYGRLTPHLTVAEDSGLEIEALDGAPGVLSARYNGSSYREKFAAINTQLAAKGATGSAADSCVRWPSRRGRISCSKPRVIDGRLADQPSGAGGFGYDPIFFYPPYGSTLAEVSAEKKAAVSHRGRAFRKLRRFLQTYGDRG